MERDETASHIPTGTTADISKNTKTKYNGTGNNFSKGQRMARRGGYGKSEPVEWVKLSQISYGEAITAAKAMRQDVQTWFADAVEHHLYRCDLLQAQQLYQADEATAAAVNRPTPDKNDPRYAVTRAKPSITVTTKTTAGLNPNLRR